MILAPGKGWFVSESNTDPEIVGPWAKEKCPINRIKTKPQRILITNLLLAKHWFFSFFIQTV
tara:strand:+ start:26161 stop:26346 length:186 start_codon:yes stop_codon:yes gene_type:complete